LEKNFQEIENKNNVVLGQEQELINITQIQTKNAYLKEKFMKQKEKLVVKEDHMDVLDLENIVVHIKQFVLDHLVELHIEDVHIKEEYQQIETLEDANGLKKINMKNKFVVAILT
jgi:hypothetical protein